MRPNLFWRVCSRTQCVSDTQPYLASLFLHTVFSIYRTLSLRVPECACDFHESTSAKCRKGIASCSKAMRVVGFQFCHLTRTNTPRMAVHCARPAGLQRSGMAVCVLLARWIESGEGCGVVVEKTVRYLRQNTTAPAQHVTVTVTTAFTTPQRPTFFWQL